MTYQKNEAFGFIMSNKYILGLYKYCREARWDFFHPVPVPGKIHSLNPT